MNKQRLTMWAVILLLCIGVTAFIVGIATSYREFIGPLENTGAGIHRIWSALTSGLSESLAQRQEARERAAARRQETERQLEIQRAALEAAQIASEPSIQEEIVIADPAITEFDSSTGRETLTGGNTLLYYYNQADEAWAEKLFGNDPIARYGCGPTVIAMAAASLAGDETATPESVALWAAQAGYCASGSGSYLSIVQGAAEHYGLECSSLDATDPAGLYETLSNGGMIVALMGPGHFTGGGHFILLHGVTLTGGILVADPNSRDNSLAVWDPQTIVDELSPSRHDGAPLWLLKKPLSL